MKKLFVLLLAALSLTASAQYNPGFVPGQILHAQELNNAIEQLVPLNGAVMSGPLTVPTLTVTQALHLSGGLVFDPALPVVSGGTGATTAAAALTNLGGLHLTGGTLTGPLIAVQDASADDPVSISGAAGVFRFMSYDTAGVARFKTGLDVSAESGSDAGSNYCIYRYHDGGGVIDCPFSITRSTGNISLSDGLHVTSGVLADTVSVTGTSLLQGSVTVTGLSTLKGDVSITGNTSTTGNISTTGSILSAGNPKVIAYNEGGQSIPDQTSTQITGWTELSDTSSAFNPTTGVFTAPVTGFYLFTGQIGLIGPITGSTTLLEAALFIGGTAYQYSLSDFAPITNPWLQFSFIGRMTTGQQAYLAAYHNAGSAKQLATAATYLSIALLP